MWLISIILALVTLSPISLISVDIKGKKEFNMECYVANSDNQLIIFRSRKQRNNNVHSIF